MLGLERDHVDEQVVAVGGCKSAAFLAIEPDDLELALRRAARTERDPPAVVRERARDRRADVARPAEDEDAARDQSTATTASPTLISPSLRMSAFRPPRCASPLMTPGCVIACRVVHGSHSSTPRHSTAPM